MKEDTGSTLSAVVTALSHHFRRDATPLRAESNRQTEHTDARTDADAVKHQSSTWDSVRLLDFFHTGIDCGPAQIPEPLSDLL